MTILSLIKDDFQPGIPFSPSQNCSPCHSQMLFINISSGLQGIDQLRFRLPSDLNVVGFLQMRFRRKYARSPFRIVGQQEQAFTGFIQSSNRRNPGKAGRQTTINRLPSFLIRCGRDQSTWLVQHQINSDRRASRKLINLDPVLSQMDRELRIAAEFPVKPHPACARQLRSL